MVGVPYLIIAVYFSCAAVSCAKDCPKICDCLGDYVDCSQKSLASVPAKIPKWTSKLNLNNNHITSLDSEALKNLSALTELKLNKNKIKVIPKDVFDSYRRLKDLELNRNLLEDIEALTFKSLEQLASLKLKRNRIRQLKDGAFYGLSRIKSLVLDYNSIQIISKTWLYGLGTLKELQISNNIVSNIEAEAWEFCQDLVVLDLSHNRLKSIEKDTFKDLVQLKKLMLNNNSITFIEEHAFDNLQNLRNLHLSYNKISWAVEDANGVFSSLNNLVMLYVASNNIKSINKNAFKNLTSITHLDVMNNNITSIQKNAFAEMPSLQELHMNTSSLLCDCNLKWFNEWLASNKFEHVRASCFYPEELRGQPLLNVPVINFTCVDLPKPRLIEQPEAEIMALKGENISLSCKAMSSSSGPMTFVWKKDNVEILNADIQVVASTLDGKNTENMSVLRIYKVQHSDAGKYQCIASNKFGTAYSQKSTISVLIFPTFVKIPRNITVQAGETARLECAAHGEPQPEIAWQKDGGNDFPAARERRMHVMPTDDVFFIINAKPHDMGIYSCTANNAAGTIVANATLTIEELPSFVKTMEDKEVTAGESVVLQCMAGGAPKPTILWLKDGVPIKATERHFFTAEDQLMIIVDTAVTDSGTYQCKLNNSLGTEIGYSILYIKPVASLGIISDSDMMGIIIITVVCCAVGTSVVWVVIIYQTRKRMAHHAPSEASHQEVTVLDFADKPLGAHFEDNSSDRSSCKDSGTGDSAKRSNDDLVPGEEYTLIINASNSTNKGLPARTASLICLVADGNNLHMPLLHNEGSLSTVKETTNHDRLERAETGEASKSEDSPSEGHIQ